MAVSDFLEKIGEGAKTVGRVAGAIAPDLGKAIVNEEAGYAPQIAAEDRANKQKLEDRTIALKEQELTTQLEMGRKYGTLTPEQQQQYIDQITGLYSHPRHAGTLMEKLRKAVHPNGAVATPGLSTLKSAVPEGGTGQADVDLANQKKTAKPVPGVHPFKGPDGKWYQPMYDAQGDIHNQEVSGYTPPEAKGGGKSPPVIGTQLPADAVGVNGDPIPPEDRNAGKSFLEFQGKWWPVAKPKPVMKKIGGHLVLMDPVSGAKLRDLGAVDVAKVTTRQTLQPGDDGQMHLVNLTSVTTPEGAQIEVTPEQETPETGTPKKEGENKPSAPAPKHVGGVLPKTNPVTAPPGGPSAGKVVPGLTTLAKSKNPLFKEGVTQLAQADKDARAKSDLYKNAQGLLADNNRKTDLELVFSWVRSNVQGAGRMTNTEIQQAANIGSWGVRVKSAVEQATTGRLSPEIEQQFLSDIKRAADTSQADAANIRKSLEGAPAQNDPKVDEFLKKF